MGIVLAIGFIVWSGGRPQQGQLLFCLSFCGRGVLCLAIAFAFFLLARGLRRLRSWARWTWVVLLSLPIAGGCVAAVIYYGVMGKIKNLPGELPVNLVVYGFYVGLPGSLLYVLLAPESRIVFSPEYRAVVARTPHIRYKMGRRTR